MTLALIGWAGLAFCWPCDLCLLRLVAKLCACTGCPCCPAHSSTPSGPSMGRCLPLSPKACAFKLFGSLIWSLGNYNGWPACSPSGDIISNNIFFFCLVCFVLFHFEAWSHSESSWPQLKAVLLLQPPKCSDYCSISDIINIVFFFLIGTLHT